MTDDVDELERLYAAPAIDTASDLIGSALAVLQRALTDWHGVE